MARQTEDRDWRELRLSTGISLAELARRTGINKGTLSAIETRDRRVEPWHAEAILAALSRTERVA